MNYYTTINGNIKGVHDNIADARRQLLKAVLVRSKDYFHALTNDYMGIDGLMSVHVNGDDIKIERVAG